MGLLLPSPEQVLQLVSARRVCCDDKSCFYLMQLNHTITALLCPHEG